MTTLKSKILMGGTLMAALGLLASQVQAATCEAVSPGKCYYVATNGSDSNPGTDVAPKATYMSLEPSLNAGDYVYFRGGTYVPAAGRNDIIDYGKNLSGASSGARITIKSYPGELAILDGQNKAPVSSNYGDVNVGGAGLILEGFEIRNNTSAAVWLQADYIEVRKNTIHDIKGNGDTNVGAFVVFGSNNGVNIHNNYFYDNYATSGNHRNASSVSFFDAAANVKVHHNYFRAFTDQGQMCVFQKHGNSNGTIEISNNTFQDCPDSGIEICGDHIFVNHNLLINSTINLNLPGGNGTASDYTVEYNTHYSNKPFSWNEDGGNLPPIYLRHNVIYQNNTGNIIGIGKGTFDNTVYTMDYNCWFNPTGAAKFEYFIYSGGGVYSLSQMQSLYGKETHSFETNPLFVNAAGSDFHTQAANCADKGIYAAGNVGDPPLSAAAALGGSSPPPDTMPPAAPKGLKAS